MLKLVLLNAVSVFAIPWIGGILGILGFLLNPIMVRWPALRAPLYGVTDLVTSGVAVGVTRWGLAKFGVELHWAAVLVLCLLVVRNTWQRVGGSPDEYAGEEAAAGLGELLGVLLVFLAL